MMPKKKVKKRNPQDATLRNIGALKKQLERLDARLKRIEKALEKLMLRALIVW